MTDLFYLLNYESKNNKVVYIKGYVGDSEIKVGIMCKNCGKLKEYTLRKGRVKTLRCLGCRKEEIMVPSDSDTGIFGFVIMGKYAYNKFTYTNEKGNHIN